MRAKLVNEAVKHLQPRNKDEIIETIKQHNDPYYQLYMAMKNDIPELVEVLLNQHSIVGSEEEDSFYTLASFYLTDEEISFNSTGYFNFKNGELYCTDYPEPDESCAQFKQFLEEHDIRCKLIRKSAIASHVEFTGNASDIIKMVFEFLIVIEMKPFSMIEQAYEIIFTG